MTRCTFEEAVNEYVEECYSYISDVSKEAQGFRVRIDVSNWTFAQLEAECDYWSRQASAADVEREEYQARCAEKFEAAVAVVREACNCDYEGAVALLIAAENDEQLQHDQGFFEYDNGLAFGYLNNYTHLFRWAEAA